MGPIIRIPRFLSTTSNDMAIDLGTVNTIVYLRGQGIVLNEPSVVAIEFLDGAPRLRAFGMEAKLMIGRTPRGTSTVRPMRDGVIADVDIAEQMIKAFIDKAHGGPSRLPRRPNVAICIPSGATEVERRAIRQAATNAGARSVSLIEEPMAAAIGAGLPVNDPVGTMVVDIGGGTTDIAVISLGSVVRHASARVGGDRMDEAITSSIRRNHNLVIGETTAERIKIAIGIARMPTNGPGLAMAVRGRDLVNGVPREIEVAQADFAGPLSDLVDQVVETVMLTLAATEPELAVDIHSHGIVMTGGGSMLPGIDEALTKATGVSVVVAETALTAVAIGAGRALEDNAYANVLMST
ncbi:rod shape-determining protein [Sphingomonas panacisoli]|uniref:Cell shape-determining protein MreB n=2 Tax=Sphingomonas panacisoli TaxID=1813879 RepID=A0A5B8LIV7_9SPHN|nr:rod shape-determining protein [Sphingomonas panacisoli]